MVPKGLPKEPGTYVLILRLARQMSLSVGQLGEFELPAGWYAYVGSAHGPGGLASRVARHQRASKKLHWHIDYLRAYSEPVVVWYATGTRRRECRWARALSRLPRASLPAAGFGASDCHCSAHLIRFPSRPNLVAFAQCIDGPVSESLLTS